jgi:hypothetical protein
MLAYVTIDHQIILAWAKRRDALPSTCEGDERPWPLFLSFGRPGAGLREISWDRFFFEFERANLAFSFLDDGPTGKLDNSYSLLNRTAVPELVVSRQATIVLQVP